MLFIRFFIPFNIVSRGFSRKDSFVIYRLLRPRSPRGLRGSPDPTPWWHRRLLWIRHRSPGPGDSTPPFRLLFSPTVSGPTRRTSSYIKIFVTKFIFVFFKGDLMLEFFLLLEMCNIFFLIKTPGVSVVKELDYNMISNVLEWYRPPLPDSIVESLIEGRKNIHRRTLWYQ